MKNRAFYLITVVVLLAAFSAWAEGRDIKRTALRTPNGYRCRECAAYAPTATATYFKPTERKTSK